MEEKLNGLDLFSGIVCAGSIQKINGHQMKICAYQDCNELLNWDNSTGYCPPHNLERLKQLSESKAKEQVARDKRKWTSGNRPELWGEKDLT